MPTLPSAPQPAINPSLALQQGVLGPASPIPTQALLVKNMFDPAEESKADPAFDVEIAADVRGECGKWGEVLHIFVDKHSQVGGAAGAGAAAGGWEGAVLAEAVR
jgi:hypothetical protein